jgi:hypothetical protein
MMLYDYLHTPDNVHQQTPSRKDDKTKVQCGVYTWLRDFSQVTLSRTLFYFGNIYSQQRMPNGRPMDVRALSAASRPDFYAVYPPSPLHAAVCGGRVRFVFRFFVFLV